MLNKWIVNARFNVPYLHATSLVPPMSWKYNPFKNRILSAERTTRMGIVVERAYRLSLTRIYKRVRRACVIVRPHSLSLHNDAQWLCPPSISRRGGDDSIDLYRHSPTPPSLPSGCSDLTPSTVCLAKVLLAAMVVWMGDFYEPVLAISASRTVSLTFLRHPAAVYSVLFFFLLKVFHK